ncbi:hypothetical protein B0T25DRAFT_537135 [Lasiosphaeria hispida]|uniref:Uncharacterized protein n=1 Tax=Lasiosphaeria hispida TaxID=260671 RepID=A0AAJ0HKN7_9PEZI|nr:hypothetical protein B0T25DRAFT_537135 [Lasiosphaeria hispida]
MTNIKTAAQSTITAYAAAVGRGGETPTSLSEVVSSTAKFYLPGWTSFTLGPIVAFKDDESIHAAIPSELNRFQSMGLGTDIRLENSRVEPISDLSAVCWLTWILKPKDEAPWRFTVAYGCSGLPRTGLTGWWEGVSGSMRTRNARSSWLATLSCLGSVLEPSGAATLRYLLESLLNF